MNQSSDLFELIKSLSKSEKRYFKLNSGHQSKEKIYIKLFDFIDSMKQYDEQRILDGFPNTTFISNLHVTKNYLYHNILKNIRSYHEKKSIDLQLFNLLSDADFLEKKGLYLQSKKVIKKAKKIAIDYHKDYLLLEIITRELDFAQLEKKQNIEEVSQLSLELHQKLSEFYTTTKYFLTKSLYFSYYRSKSTLSIKDIDDNLQKISPSLPFLEDASEHDSFYGKFNSLQAKTYHYRFQNKYIPALKAYQKVLQLWEEHPKIIKEKPHLYKMHISNYLSICINIGQIDDFPIWLEKLKSIKSQSFNEEAETFQNTYYLELYYFSNIGALKAATMLVPTITEGLKKYAHKINKARQLTFYHNIMVVYFILQDYPNALDWLNKIIHDQKSTQREDLQQFARIMQLVLHYELNNDRVLDYLFQSTYRSLKRQRELQPFEQLTLDLLKQLLTATTEKEKRQFFAQFLTDINALASADRRSLGCEELAIWAEAKVKQVTMETILLQHLKASDS